MFCSEGLKRHRSYGLVFKTLMVMANVLANWLIQEIVMIAGSVSRGLTELQSMAKSHIGTRVNLVEERSVFV